MPMQDAPPPFDPLRYKETTREQWQRAAEAWDRWTPTLQSWLGPATELMLDLAGVGPGDRILDIAAGAGEPAMTAAKRVGSTGSVLATDISSNILAYAQRAASAQGLTNLQTRVMDGEHLEVPDAAFDAVLSRLGLIYFPDRQRALAEIRRVLVSGGRIAAMVYATAENNQFFSIPIGIIRRRAQLPPPAPGQPGPFSLGGAGVLEAAYRQAGFREIAIRTVAAPLRMASAEEYVRFARESFGALHQMLAGVTEAEREAAWDEITRELRQFEGSEGFVGPCELIVGVGTKE
ncbi:MAG TPA: methyltransferase domain-containing protein [Actinomycetota bacterium]|nr:methyltransferase domain-containing protein [Actinomycetota bacterium]